MLVWEGRIIARTLEKEKRKVDIVVRGVEGAQPEIYDTLRALLLGCVKQKLRVRKRAEARIYSRSLWGRFYKDRLNMPEGVSVTHNEGRPILNNFP